MSIIYICSCLFAKTNASNFNQAVLFTVFLAFKLEILGIAKKTCRYSQCHQALTWMRWLLLYLPGTLKYFP